MDHIPTASLYTTPTVDRVARRLADGGAVCAYRVSLSSALFAQHRWTDVKIDNKLSLKGVALHARSLDQK